MQFLLIEVIQHRTRYDGDELAHGLIAASFCGEPFHDPRHGREPVGGAARKHHGVHLVHHLFGAEEVGLPGAGGAPSAVRAAHRALLREDDGHARELVLGGADDETFRN